MPGGFSPSDPRVQPSKEQWVIALDTRCAGRNERNSLRRLGEIASFGENEFMRKIMQVSICARVTNGEESVMSVIVYRPRERMLVKLPERRVTQECAG